MIVSGKSTFGTEALVVDRKGGKLFDRIKEVVHKMTSPQGLPQIAPDWEPGVPGEPPPEDAPLKLQEMSLEEWSQQAGVVGTIRTAAKRRTLIMLTYNGVQRHVEAYSFRTGRHGVLFYGYCRIHNEIHSFYLHRIDAVELTDIPYSPRWYVEL